jgi:hypothetical protein
MTVWGVFQHPVNKPQEAFEFSFCVFNQGLNCQFMLANGAG